MSKKRSPLEGAGRAARPIPDAPSSTSEYARPPVVAAWTWSPACDRILSSAVSPMPSTGSVLDASAWVVAMPACLRRRIWSRLIPATMDR